MAPPSRGQSAVDQDHIFISYSHTDSSFVERIVSDLQAEGITAWFDRKGLQAGMPNWERVVRDAIDRSFAVVVIASPEAFLSDDVHGELSIAKSRARPVYPVWAHGEIWEDCIPANLIKTQHVDCRGERYTNGIVELVADLRRLRQSAKGDGDHANLMPSHAQPTSVMIIAPPGSDTPKSQPDTIVEADDKLFSDLVDALATLGSCQFTIKRTSRLSDISKLVAGTSCEILQFLGIQLVPVPHGEKRAGTETNTTAIQISSLARLLSDCLPSTVRVLIVVAPELALPQVRELVPCAPYTVFVETGHEDGAAQAFTTQFYRSYQDDRSVERAFRESQLRLAEGMPAAGTPSAWLDKRARYNAEGALLVEARVSGFPDTLTIDLGQVQDSLEHLALPRDTLIDLLAKKIRVHRTAFDVPRDHAILPIDAMLHGEFSWDALAGSVTCHKLFRFRDDIDLIQWKEWCRLLVAYNDLCSERFRTVQRPGDPAERGAITRALQRYEAKYRDLEASVIALEQIGLRTPRLAYVAGLAYLELAREKVIEQEWGGAAVQLEFALSRLHDAVTLSMPATA